MTIDVISKEVARIQKKYSTKNLYALCRAIKIKLVLIPMGRKACMGFYLLHSRTQLIVINSDLPEKLQRIILVHEVGHAVLHRHISKTFQDFVLFEEASYYEYEANIFTAEFLIADDDVLDLLTEDLSFFGIASRLNVPPELLDFKFRIMKRKGHELIDPPLRASSNFLKNVW